MLKLIMGVEEAEKYIDANKFVEYPNSFFNDNKKREWFKTDFAKRLIREIDKAEIIQDFALLSNIRRSKVFIINI